MHHTRGNAQWSGDPLHVRSEVVMRLDEPHFEAYGFLNPVIIQCDKNATVRLRPDFELQSLSKTVYIVNHLRKLKNQYPQQHRRMALFLKRFLVGHVPKLVELMFFF